MQAAKNIQELRERISEIEALLEKEEASAREKNDVLQSKLVTIGNFVETSSDAVSSFSPEY